MFPIPIILINKSARLYERYRCWNKWDDVDKGWRERNSYCDVEKAAGQYEQRPYENEI